MIFMSSHVGGLSRNSHTLVFDNSDASVGYTSQVTLTLGDKSASSYILEESIDGGAYTSVTLDVNREAVITSDLNYVHLLRHSYIKDGVNSPTTYLRVGNLIANGGFEVDVANWTLGSGDSLIRSSTFPKFGTYGSKLSAVQTAFATTDVYMVDSTYYVGAWFYRDLVSSGATIRLTAKRIGTDTSASFNGATAGFTLLSLTSQAALTELQFSVSHTNPNAERIYCDGIFALQE